MSTSEKDAFVKKYFLPHLNVIKFFPADGSNNWGFNNTRYTLNGAVAESPNSKNDPQAALGDGSVVQFRIYDNNTGSAYFRTLSWIVDTNGAKKPNTIGRDNFSFDFYALTGEFLPHGVYTGEAYNEETKSFPRTTEAEVYQNCGGGGSGWYCAARIIKEGFKINY